MIKEGSHDDIGTEKLRGLLKILPPMDEVEMLKAYDGDVVRLGNAEKFLLHLMTIPHYRLRIESMLLKEEFASNIAYLEPSIHAMIMAGDELKNNVYLQDVLYMVLLNSCHDYCRASIILTLKKKNFLIFYKSLRTSPRRLMQN